MRSWDFKQLESLGRIVTGKTPPTRVLSHYGGDTPFITPTDMDGSRYVVSSTRKLTETGVASVVNTVLPAGSVMVSCIASLGKVAVTTEKSVTNQQINSVIPNQDVDSKFLYYSLLNIEPTLRAIAAGSVQPIVNKTQFGKITIPVPDIDEQRRIAHILGTLDDKIELNRQMNKTLDEIARTLFRSWFVDFDPVRAKMEGREPDGMDAATAALFPDRLVDSELGPIPEGWEVRPIGELCDVRWGDTSTTKSSYVVEPGFVAYSASGPDGYLPHADYHQDGIVLSAIGANCGKTWLAQGRWSCIKNTIRLLQIEGSMSIYYLYYATLDPTIWPKRGSAQPFISQGDARLLRVIVPVERTLKAFDSLLLPILDLMSSNEKENVTLSQMRDTLQPELLSGRQLASGTVGV